MLYLISHSFQIHLDKCLHTALRFVLYFQNIGFTPVVPANKKELEDKLQKSLKEVEL